MTLFAIFSKPDDGPEAIEAIRHGFSWTAFLFTPIWALIHRAWLVLLVWVILVLTLDRLALAIGFDTAFALYGVFALWVGFAAPQIRERVLARRNWLAHGDVSAPSLESAELTWLSKVYGARI